MTKSFLFTTYALVILLSAYLGISIYEHQTVSRKIEIINEPIIQYEIEEPITDLSVIVKPDYNTFIESQATKAGVSVDNADELTTMIKQKAYEYDLPDYIAFAIVNTESDFYVEAKQQKTNCVGLCQVSQKCLDEYNDKMSSDLTLDDVYCDIEKNLDVGFWYFNRLLTAYGSAYSIDDFDDAYLAYNVGPVNYKKYKSHYQNNKMPDGSKYNAKQRWAAKKDVWQNFLKKC